MNRYTLKKLIEKMDAFENKVDKLLEKLMTQEDHKRMQPVPVKVRTKK